ncbi:uncharacterized protein LOC141692483 [Apium graveolens]|uniref:uncharacterized protein LOC141692483 n=1 Tax=Apium graveolens TaxID=4045 RepID=UPI003D79169D
MTRKYMKPILQKVPNIVKIAVFLTKTLKKPVVPRLVAFKNSRKHKKVSLLQHYGYGYVKEYQFSPSHSPLVSYKRKQYKKRSYRDLCSILYMCNCLGRFEDDSGVEGLYNNSMDYQFKALPEKEVMECADSCDEEEESVDARAGRFIEKFYEEIRMQKKEPVLQLGGINAY